MVCFEGLCAGALRLSKGRWVQNNYVKLLFISVCLLQVVEYIGYKKLMGIGIKIVENEMLPGGLNGWRRNVDAGNGGLVAGQCSIDRETTRVTEAVQDPLVPRILA